jgi:hypothetical protein
MSHVNVCKRNAIATLLVQPELNIDDLEQDYLSLLGSTTDQVNDAWVQVFKKFGAIASQFNTAAMELLLGQGATGTNLTDNWKWFWCVNGGIVVGDTIDVLDSDGNAFTVPLIVLNSVGLPFTVTNIVLDSDGNPMTVSLN